MKGQSIVPVSTAILMINEPSIEIVKIGGIPITSSTNPFRNGKRPIQAIAVSMILISMTMSGCIEEGPGPQTNIISFSVSITVEGPTELILPMPIFQPLLENISVVEGECEHQRVETPYGDGLWVRLDSFAGIGHKWIEDERPHILDHEPGVLDELELRTPDGLVRILQYDR